MIFGDVLKIKNGRNQKTVENPDGKYPIYGSGGVMGYADDYICTANTVVLGRKGSINNPIFVERPFWNVDTAFGLEANPEVLIPKYLYYFCKHFNFEKLNKAVTIPSLTKADLLKIEIDLPKLSEQQSIVLQLSKVEDVILLRQHQLQKLDELIKARFVELFGNFVYDRDRWQICEVGDVADTVDPQPSHRTPPTSSDGVPYIGVAECNYRTRLIDFEKARKVGQNVLQEHIERYTLDEGDFIIGKIGTIGKPFFIPAEQTYTLSANTVLIKPIKEKVAPQYLFSVFQSEYMDRIIDAEKKSTSQPAFGIQKVRKIEVPLPPMELQRQFTAFVAQVDKSKVVVQKALDEAQTLFDSLMQQYFG